MARKNTSRQAILDAAEQEFSDHGYYPASMDAIAERAGVAKGTLYYNFTSKVDLFVEVVTEGLRYLTGVVREAADSDLPLDERLTQIVRVQVDMLYDYPRIAAILFREMTAGLDEAATVRIAAVRDEYISFLASILVEGMEAGYIRRTDPRLAATVLVEAGYAACAYAKAAASASAPATEVSAAAATPTAPTSAGADAAASIAPASAAAEAPTADATVDTADTKERAFAFLSLLFRGGIVTTPSQTSNQAMEVPS